LKIYTLHTRQHLPISLEVAWTFFSRPENLRLITPPWLDFRITNTVPETMYPGTIITYTVRPLLGIPMPWTTEITYIDPPHYFADEQRFGPYRMWHHKHFFRAVEDGVEMEDLVHYALPLSLLSQVVQPWLVRPRIDAIFCYRQEALAQRFGTAAPDRPLASGVRDRDAP
jgi:ligand-binding SRPBCC domain-containing protein